MKRFTPDTQDTVYDLVIAGGGIYGSAMAYTASLNNLKAVVLEKGDFASSTSANSQKVIHGGLRYLQNLDIKRVVESIKEKQRFYHLFPHQVQPLPCVLPTSGWMTNSNEAFRMAFLLYGLLQKITCRGSKLSKHLDKKPHLLSKKEMVRRFSHLKPGDIRGGALWFDGLCVEPERVILGLLKGATRLGTKAANYAEIRSIERLDPNVLLVTVYDHQNEKTYQLKTRKVALCTGADFKDDLGPETVPQKLQDLTLIRGINILLPALFKSKTSLATKIRNGNESRFLFIVPWKKYSIGGTHWKECTNHKAPWDKRDETQETFHSLMQKALTNENTLPATLSCHLGYVPGVVQKQGGQTGAEQILPHFKLIDRESKQQGDVLQIVGVKFTTAFDVTFKALKKLFPQTPIQDVLEFSTRPYGSPAENELNLLEKYQSTYQFLLTGSQVKQLFNLVGSDLPRIVQNYLVPLQKDREPLDEIHFYKALTLFSVQEEMTLHLHDLIFRRLFPDSPELPEAQLLDSLAGYMAELLMWSAEQKRQELDQVRDLREKSI